MPFDQIARRLRGQVDGAVLVIGPFLGIEHPVGFVVLVPGIGADGGEPLPDAQRHIGVVENPGIAADPCTEHPPVPRFGKPQFEPDRILDHPLDAAERHCDRMRPVERRGFDGYRRLGREDGGPSNLDRGGLADERFARHRSVSGRRLRCSEGRQNTQNGAR